MNQSAVALLVTAMLLALLAGWSSSLPKFGINTSSNTVKYANGASLVCSCVSAISAMAILRRC